MTQLIPYPFQMANVAHFVNLPGPRSLWVLDETGLGKSVTAILAAKVLGSFRVLVVTKGMVRPSWMARLREWYPERAADVAAITKGKGRKLSGPAAERLRLAYQAPIQVVSYDLLHHVTPWAWDLIILDEIHEIVSYRSAIAQTLRSLFRNCPAADKLGLTATLLTAEPKNVWNLLQLYWPADWGKATPSGEPPWKFLHRYCVRFETEWGVSYRGLNAYNAEEFAAKLAAVSVRTLRSDVAHLLPPIDCSPLLVEAGNKSTDGEIAIDWLKTAVAESTHVSVFTYYRESARWLIDELQMMARFRDHTMAMVDGSHTPEHRHATLERLKRAPKGILVGTMDSLGTGISLTAFHQYLITEATTTANKLVQVLGRYSRLDSQTPCRGFILLREGRDDDKIATLSQRLEDFNTLIKAGQGEVALLGTLSGSLTGDAFDRRLDDLLASFTNTLDEDDEDDAESVGVEP